MFFLGGWDFPEGAGGNCWKRISATKALDGFVSAKAAFSAVAAGTCIAGRGPQRLRSRGQRTQKTLQRAVVTSPTKTQTEQPGDFVFRMAWGF